MKKYRDAAPSPETTELGFVPGRMEAATVLSGSVVEASMLHAPDQYPKPALEESDIRGKVSARRLTLHLPRRWPWETQFSRALARLQAIPFPA